MSTPSNFRNLSGQRFGRLVVIGRGSSRPPNRYAYWLCRCDCGNTIETRSTHLLHGRTKSCGCLHQENLVRGIGTKHGYTGTPEYRIWAGIRARCNNPNDTNYHYYGGRGISVCAEWDSFETFLADMGEKPSEQHSLDRIDNDGPYAPGNCRWVTHKEQMQNTRNVHTLTFNGETLSVTAWSEKVGLPMTTLANRIRSGWSTEEALTIPRLPRGSRRTKR